jgi:hypothetical protein
MAVPRDRLRLTAYGLGDERTEFRLRLLNLPPSVFRDTPSKSD